MRLRSGLAACLFFLTAVGADMSRAAAAEQDRFDQKSGLQPVPNLTGRVVDLTATLSSSEVGELESRLRAFEEQKGSQLAVLIVSSTAPEDIAQYSIRVVEKWKLGRKKVDDGALLLVAKDDRTLRIEVGYGLEGALTDIASKRIISDIITPEFKSGNFYGGVSAGVDAILKVIQGEPLPEPAVSRGGFGRRRSHLDGGFLIGLLVGGFFLSSALRAIFGRLGGGFLTGGAAVFIAWFALGSIVLAVGLGFIAFLVTLFGGGGGGGRSFGGGWGGGFGGGGGGWSGGGGGGGFSGGGGSFGGGGSSGSW